MKRSVAELGFPGFEIGTHVKERNLEDPFFDPIYKTAEDLNACLFVHPWDMPSLCGRHDKFWLQWLVGMPSETATAICSILMGDVLNKFPRLRFCFAHGGGAYPQIWSRVQHGYNCRPDLCATHSKSDPSSFHGKFYVDSLVHSPLLLRSLVDLLGEDKVILGTDYPFPLGDLEPGKMFHDQDHLFSRETQAKILWDNAADLLRL